MRINVPPGKYNPITSDFDRLKLKIYKHKKISNRSDWAQNIAFESTETRFRDKDYDNEVPPPTNYHPKTGIADTLPRSYNTGQHNAFGSTGQRFREAERRPEDNISKDKRLEMDLNREINHILSEKAASSYDGRSRTSPAPIRPKYNASNFAPAATDRFQPIKSPPGPPPGAYDVRPKWDTVGVVPMAPAVVICKKQPESMPG
jgi:hypothetical protein